MAKERIILGIDPGLATIGYGLIRVGDGVDEIIDFGVIETPAGLEMPERLLMIQKDIDELVRQYEPSEVYVEELFFSSNVKTAMDVAHARGVILLALQSRGLRPRSLKPNEIKLAMTGDGRADKRQVQDMLQMQFSLPELPRPDDAADALAIAYTGSLAFSGHLS